MEEISSLNYLNNKDLLSEIHKSKMNFCQYSDIKFTDYSIIIHPESFDLPETHEHSLDFLKKRCLDPDVIKEAKANKAHKINISNKGKKLKKLTADDIETDDLVFRVLTYDHIPYDTTNRKKNPKNIGDIKDKVNFIPFIHYIIKNGELIEVCRSHYKDGSYNPLSGNITDKLADMFMMLVNRYSQRSNWRGYTYVNEMKGQALLHLVYMGLKFNEHKSDNPFAYYTQAISNSFTRVLNEEKQHQDLRDDLLEEMGHNPSFTRQLDNDEEMRSSKLDS